MPTPRTPQDRKPKSAPFSFTGADGKKHTLPKPSTGVEHVDGQSLRDAIMGGEAENAVLGFKMLEACKAPKASLDALYGLPAPKMLGIINDWMQSEGVSLGESPSSAT